MEAIDAITGYLASVRIARVGVEGLAFPGKLLRTIGARNDRYIRWQIGLSCVARRVRWPVFGTTAGTRARPAPSGIAIIDIESHVLSVGEIGFIRRISFQRINIACGSWGSSLARSAGRLFGGRCRAITTQFGHHEIIDQAIKKAAEYHIENDPLP